MDPFHLNKKFQFKFVQKLTQKVFKKFGDMSLKEFISEQPNYELQDIKKIVWQLLQAVDTVHQQGLIHRDIKPANVVIDKSSRDISLIDFGLAEFYFPDKSYNLRIATRPFKPVEVLVNYRKYFQSFDIWGVGNILGCLVGFAGFGNGRCSRDPT